MYTDYQIRASLIDTLNHACSVMGVTGFLVMARNQPGIVHDTDVVILDKISQKRIGFEVNRPWIDGNGAMHNLLEWTDELTWQISACRQAKMDDTVDTQTADDVAVKLMTWLNSAVGAKYMRGREDCPFAPIHTSSKRTVAYNDESDVFQHEEQFDFRMQVVQVVGLDSESISTPIRWETNPI